MICRYIADNLSIKYKNYINFIDYEENFHAICNAVVMCDDDGTGTAKDELSGGGA